VVSLAVLVLLSGSYDAPIFSFQVDVSSDYSLPNWVSGNPASPILLDISGMMFLFNPVHLEYLES